MVFSSLRTQNCQGIHSASQTMFVVVFNNNSFLALLIFFSSFLLMLGCLLCDVVVDRWNDSFIARQIKIFIPEQFIVEDIPVPDTDLRRSYRESKAFDDALLFRQKAGEISVADDVVHGLVKVL